MVVSFVWKSKYQRRLSFLSLVSILTSVLAFSGNVYCNTTAESTPICQSSLHGSSFEKAWERSNAVTNKEAPVQLQFKSRDYNELLYFLNTLGGVTQLSTFFQSDNPNVLVTLVPLKELRNQLSDEYLKDVIPWTPRFFDFVLNLSQYEKYNALAIDPVVLTQMGQKKESGVSAEPKKAGFLTRIGRKLKEFNAQIDDPNYGASTEAKRFLGMRGTLASLKNLNFSDLPLTWSVLFIDYEQASDVEDYLGQIGFDHRVRVIDHINVLR